MNKVRMYKGLPAITKRLGRPPNKRAKVIIHSSQLNPKFPKVSAIWSDDHLKQLNQTE